MHASEPLSCCLFVTIKFITDLKFFGVFSLDIYSLSTKTDYFELTLCLLLEEFFKNVRFLVNFKSFSDLSIALKLNSCTNDFSLALLLTAFFLRQQTLAGLASILIMG